MEDKLIEERRKRLREVAMRVCEEYGIGGKRTKAKPQRSQTIKAKGCKICGAPIEKTGKPGRPPTKCLKHR